ncbi:MAG: phenylalanine--tRNA ligase subunit beta [Gemmatimonadota bacterium]|nr:phenylalanine--tRNA ligase subunit beta [Gemmatimonadota bacterium]
MNISHEWLKAFVPHALSAEQLRDLLTAHVATVEGFERTRTELSAFVVGQVVESEKIPETRLSFNKVDDGSGSLLEVVCGAPNVTVGAKYPFARSGTTMPGGLLIEKRKIRGFTSNGMLCSPRELGLGDDHDGILELTTDAATGTPLLDVLPLSDTRLVVDVLPNRPDLLSHQGFAREVSALTNTPVAVPAELGAIPLPPTAVIGAREAKAGAIAVRLADTADCPRYCAVVVRGVKVGPSPDWLRARVESVGGRSINNVVDATNYVLHGLGQPVHAFDLAKLGGSTINVRRARPGESLVTLDGVDRTLDGSVLVIADADRPVALAGIMGGKASEVTESTTDVLLEVAAFSAKVVRGGRRLVGLNTDASYRYERGIDDVAVPRIAAVAAGLLASVSGGTVEHMVVVGDMPAPRPPVSLRVARVGRLLGDVVNGAETRALLESIGFGVTGGSETFTVTAPSWRHDIARDVDLIEEVARLRGYDRLPDTLTGARPGNVPDHPMHTVSSRVRAALTALGLLEIRPLPYVAASGSDANVLVRVRNPLGEDEPFLRRRLADTLARRAEYNLTRMQGDVRIFEIGTAFIPEGSGLREEMRVGALVMGARRPAHFTEPVPPAYDAWDAKALGEAITIAAWPGARVSLAAGTAGDLWTVTVDGTVVGRVYQAALDAPIWASPAFGIEITLGDMPATPVAARGAHNYADRAGAAGGAHVRYRSLPSTPAAEFDLAFVVPDSIGAAQVESALRTAGGDLLESVVVFDEYRGDKVPPGTRSLAWRLTFRHPERTLREKEIEGRRAQLLKSLKEELGIVVRAG